MSYADLLNHTPVANRTSSDRLISPPRPHHRASLTPDVKHNTSQSRFAIPISPSQSERFKLPRACMNAKTLFPTNSQEMFGSTRRQSSDIPSPKTPSSPSKRYLPSKPSHKINLKYIPSDFYISPIDWSINDQIALCTDNELLFIQPKTMDITTIENSPFDSTSVKFSPNGELLAVGTDDGIIQILSTQTNSITASYQLFEGAVLTSDWDENYIVSGGRDGRVSIIDPRDPSPSVFEHMHYEEVCAIKINSESDIFATSSNDGTVKVWDIKNIKNPIISYEEHCAAIRAIQWSPISNEIICSGGGTSDKTIKIWNYQTGETLQSVDTGSQVCNLYWNEEYNEIVSTHGFSQNHLGLWKGSDLSPIAQFHEHKQRVLFMAVSPDGSKVVTAAPEDSLQIWKMFPTKRLSLAQSMLLLR